MIGRLSVQAGCAVNNINSTVVSLSNCSSGAAMDVLRGPDMAPPLSPSANFPGDHLSWYLYEKSTCGQKCIYSIDYNKCPVKLQNAGIY